MYIIECELTAVNSIEIPCSRVWNPTNRIKSSGQVSVAAKGV